MSWIIAPNLAKLRANVRSLPQFREMVIGSIGDDAHKLRTSSHNPDDTPGSRAEYSDPDNVAEVRALDFMVGQISLPHMEALRRALTDDLRSRPRVSYVIFRGRIWRRSNGFRMETFDGDFHGDHIHLSGYAPDDENGADWPAVLALGSGEDDDMFCKYGDQGPKVRYLQRRLNRLGAGLALDSKYGDATAAALDQVVPTDTQNGKDYNDWAAEVLDEKLRWQTAVQRATALLKAHTDNHPAGDGGIPPGSTVRLEGTITRVL